MPDWFYEQCQRCGNPQSGERARRLHSGRLVCGTCYEEELPLIERFCVVDDGIVRSWEETQAFRHTDKSTSGG